MKKITIGEIPYNVLHMIDIGLFGLEHNGKHMVEHTTYMSFSRYGWYANYRSYWVLHSQNLCCIYLIRLLAKRDLNVFLISRLMACQDQCP